MKDRITVFFNKHNNKDTAPVFCLSPPRCSTVKSRSKREKLNSAPLRGVRALRSATAENFNNTKSQTRY